MKIDNHHKITTRHGIFQTFFGRQQLQRTWFKEVETNKGATTTKVWFSKRDNQCRFRNRRNDANLKDRLHPSLSVATSVAVPSSIAPSTSTTPVGAMRDWINNYSAGSTDEQRKTHMHSLIFGLRFLYAVQHESNGKNYIQMHCDDR